MSKRPSAEGGCTPAGPLTTAQSRLQACVLGSSEVCLFFPSSSPAAAGQHYGVRYEWGKVQYVSFQHRCVFRFTYHVCTYANTNMGGETTRLTSTGSFLMSLSAPGNVASTAPSSNRTTAAHSREFAPVPPGEGALELGRHDPPLVPPGATGDVPSRATPPAGPAVAVSVEAASVPHGPPSTAHAPSLSASGPRPSPGNGSGAACVEFPLT